MDCSPPGSSVHGILQEWVAFPTPGRLLDPGIQPMSLVSPALAGGSFTAASPGKPQRSGVETKSEEAWWLSQPEAA